jgi:hypothetical protein
VRAGESAIWSEDRPSVQPESELDLAEKSAGERRELALTLEEARM